MESVSGFLCPVTMTLCRMSATRFALDDLDRSRPWRRRDVPGRLGRQLRAEGQVGPAECRPLELVRFFASHEIQLVATLAKRLLCKRYQHDAPKRVVCVRGVVLSIPGRHNSLPLVPEHECEQSVSAPELPHAQLVSPAHEWKHFSKELLVRMVEERAPMVVGRPALIRQCNNLVHKHAVNFSAIDVTQFQPISLATVQLVPSVQLVPHLMPESLAHGGVECLPATFDRQVWASHRRLPYCGHTCCLDHAVQKRLVGRPGRDLLEVYSIP